MRKAGMVAAAMLMLMGSGTAGAHAFNGAAKIAAGDYAAAERELRAQRGIYPDDVDLMINLATVYLRTGRMDAARRTLLAVTARPDEEVVLADNTSRSSHALATDALSRLPTQIAAR